MMGQPKLLSFAALVLIAIAVAPSGTACAADWPQWRHDATRSGVTDEGLPADLTQQWVLSLGKAAPAYAHQFRMCADYSYAPVAGDGMLFVPSGVTDQVMAFDLQTGELRWRHVTDGPVRFAPIFDTGRLYFASDDGYLYCVEAATGLLEWRCRGVPENTPDMLMLVNGRMVSRWPARGAPVLSHEKVFFGAGIWPEEGAYVNAVDAESGSLIWRSDALSIIKEGMCDHGSNLDLSLPPQGYMAVINNKLAVSSGRTLAAWFDIDTGKMDPYTSFYVKKSNPRGTWYVAGNSNFWIQGGNWFGARPDAIPPRPENTRCPLSWSRKSPENAEFQLENRPFLFADVNGAIGGEVYYSEPVISVDSAYTSLFDDARDHLVLNGETPVRFKSFDRIVAWDLTKPQWNTMTSVVDGLAGRQDVSIIQFPVRWEMKTSLRVLMKGGDYLVAGERDRISAVSIPGKGESPSITWEAEIDGNPINILLSDGNLVTVTDTGKVYCFAAGSERNVGIPYVETLERSPKHGYALLLGLGDGKAALELANNPEWRVVIVEKDPQKVRQSRAALNELGLYGRRAQAICARQNMELTPYWANRVVVNDATIFDDAKRTLSVATDSLRPYGGEMPLGPTVDRTVLAEIVGDRIDYQIDGNALIRVSAPEGAADWAQETAEGDNSFVSRDKLVKWPLGILWYSGDIDRFLPPFTDLTHIRTPYPLVKHGRMFMFTHEILHAFDIYTGNYLWSRSLPKTPYVNTRRFINRLYGKPTERSYLLAEDGVYCVTGEEIHVFDAERGEPTHTLSVPEELRGEAEAAASQRMQKKMRDYDDVYEIQPVPEWTEVRIWKDSIIAKVGNTLVAVDRHDGRLLWSRKGTLDCTVCAIGGNVLYALDCIPDKYSRREEQFEKTGKLCAIDPVNGTELWSRKVSYLSWPKGISRSIFPWMNPAMPALGFNTKHNLLVMTYNGLSVKVFQAGNGSELWSKETHGVKEPSWIYSPNILDDHIMMSLSKYQSGMGFLVDILTGEQLKEQVNVPRARTCGRMIGNTHLLSYRDGATELYDIDNDRTIPLNSLRTGCTTSFVPACGIMTAPMMAHGCVCNYPMFASLAMIHMPESDSLRPEAVRQSWGADQRALAE